MPPHPPVRLQPPRPSAEAPCDPSLRLATASCAPPAGIGGAAGDAHPGRLLCPARRDPVVLVCRERRPDDGRATAVRSSRQGPPGLLGLPYLWQAREHRWGWAGLHDRSSTLEAARREYGDRRPCVCAWHVPRTVARCSPAAGPRRAPSRWRAVLLPPGLPWQRLGTLRLTDRPMVVSGRTRG